MTLAGRILRWVAGIFKSLDEGTKKLVPIAIGVINGLKAAINNPVEQVIESIILAAIPGDKDDILVAKIREVVNAWIPKILKELYLIESIANIKDTNEKLKAILVQLNLSSDESKDILYRGLCALILEKLSDGKLSFSEAGEVAEYYYRNFTKTNTLPK